MDIQTRLFDQIKSKLPSDLPLGKALMIDLNLSRDSAYRRARGETALTPEEIQILCVNYSISFDKILGIEGTAVTFQYNPISRSEFTLENYLLGINEAFKRMAAQKTYKLYYSSLDMTVFQLYNFPALIRFKLLFFAKSYLKIPKYLDQKFSRDWVGDISNELIYETLQKYIRAPSEEVVGIECAKGLVREIISFHDLGHFESKEEAIFLLNECKKMIAHFKDQIEKGRKFQYEKPIVSEEGNFKVYLHETYIQDNTFIVETNAYRILYITHNMMNYLYTVDTDYVNRSFSVFKTMLKSCKDLTSSPSTLVKYEEHINEFIERAKIKIGEDSWM